MFRVFVIIHLLSSMIQGCFLWIYRPIHNTDLVILSGADLEYTKQYFYNFMVNNALLEYIY